MNLADYAMGVSIEPPPRIGQLHICSDKPKKRLTAKDMPQPKPSFGNRSECGDKLSKENFYNTWARNEAEGRAIRDRLYKAIFDKPSTTKELSPLVHKSPKTINKHLAILRCAGLIKNESAGLGHGKGARIWKAIGPWRPL